jgi:hypothetical protein
MIILYLDNRSEINFYHQVERRSTLEITLSQNAIGILNIETNGTEIKIKPDLRLLQKVADLVHEIET